MAVYKYTDYTDWCKLVIVCFRDVVESKVKFD